MREAAKGLISFLAVTFFLALVLNVYAYPHIPLRTVWLAVLAGLGSLAVVGRVLYGGRAI